MAYLKPLQYKILQNKEKALAAILKDHFITIILYGNNDCIRVFKVFY